MIILHINDVLPSIDGRKDFVVANKDGYTVVDYVYTQPDTFDDPIRRELRGLKFDQYGNVLARPLHKFFNVGEREETLPNAIDWSRPHFIAEKLDGSMIHPANVNGSLRLMTRMGHTDVAQQCELAHMNQSLADALTDIMCESLTPVFEWTAPNNRIVLSYDESRLSLLAMRDVVTGEYLDRDTVNEFACDMGFYQPKILATDAHGDWVNLERHVQDLEGEEGFVVWFTDGLEPRAVKVKAPWYVTRHRALDSLRHEHHVLKLTLEDGVDDVLPMLSDSDRHELERYETSVMTWLNECTEGVETFVNQHSGKDQKEFATLTKSELPKPLQSVVFQCRAKDAHPRDVLVNLIVRNCNNGPKCTTLLTELNGPRWSV